MKNLAKLQFVVCAPSESANSLHQNHCDHSFDRDDHWLHRTLMLAVMPEGHASNENAMKIH
jgi:hypothetical protein